MPSSTAARNRASCSLRTASSIATASSKSVARLQGLSSAPLETEFLEHFRRAAVGRIRLALAPDGLAQLAHLDTNGKHAQHEAWTGRKRALTRLSTLRREQDSFEHAQRYLTGMESPPPGGGLPHW